MSAPLDSHLTDAELLRRRAESLAAPAEQQSVAEVHSVLLFRVGREWFGVPVSDVREIFHDFQVAALPCVPSHVLGVVNVRGEIISVVDPARMMGLLTGSVDVGPQTTAVVLAAEEVVTALVVDEIGDIAGVDPRDLELSAGIVDRYQAEYLSASVFHEGAMVGLLNTAKVLEPVVSNRR